MEQSHDDFKERTNGITGLTYRDQIKHCFFALHYLQMQNLLFKQYWYLEIVYRTIKLCNIISVPCVAIQ